MTVTAELIVVSGYFSNNETLCILICWHVMNNMAQIWISISLGTLSIYEIINAEKLQRTIFEQQNC